eukprot:3979-Hanusia_phi.AAC.3
MPSQPHAPDGDEYRYIQMLFKDAETTEGSIKSDRDLEISIIQDTPVGPQASEVMETSSQQAIHAQQRVDLSGSGHPMPPYPLQHVKQIIPPSKQPAAPWQQSSSWSSKRGRNAAGLGNGNSFASSSSSRGRSNQAYAFEDMSFDKYSTKSTANCFSAFLFRRKKDSRLNLACSVLPRHSVSLHGAVRESFDDGASDLTAVEVYSNDINWICRTRSVGLCEVHRVIVRGKQMIAKVPKARLPFELSLRAQADILNEAKLISALPSHRNIVQFGGLVNDEIAGQRPVLLTEMVSMTSLADFLQERQALYGEGQWRPNRLVAMGWCLGMERGLAFLHSRQPPLVHADLKPANLILSEDLNNIKIADFGLGSSVDHSEARDPSVWERQRNFGTGTYRYMAPELAERICAPNEQTDVYSSAIIMWEICTGMMAFSHAIHLLADENVRKFLRPPVDRIGWVPLINVIEAAWHQEPARRPTASKICDDLQGLIKQSQTRFQRLRACFL